MDHVRQFIEAMEAAGIAPSNPAEIVADDKRRRYHIAGDKPRKLNGIYQLRSDGDFSVGWFKSFKHGETISWHSKSARKFTPEERAAWKARVEASKAAADAERARLTDAAEARAKRLWSRAQAHAPQSPLPPYLADRGYTSAPGTRRIGDMLLVPGWESGGQLRTIQCITGSGDKRFLRDGEKAGCFCVIAVPGDDKSRIIVCEGYATGLAIYEATGCPVVVAYDAGNLAQVAQAFRVKYPESEIIFAADNDRWTLAAGFKPSGVDHDTLAADDPVWDAWRQAGHCRNVGVLAAQQAAVRIGGARVVIPSFLDIASRPTDFDDLRRQEGAPAVLAAFAPPAPADDDEIPLPPPPDDYGLERDYEAEYGESARAMVELYSAAEKRKPEKPQSDDWKKMLIRKEDGSMNGGKTSNLMLYMEHDPTLSRIFCYDEFSRRKFVYTCPPWEQAARFKPHPVGDNDITHLAAHIEKIGFSMAFQNVARVLDAAVKNNPRNPAQEYFSGLVWDGVPRLDDWLIRYCGARFESPEYVRAVGRKFLTAIVARVMHPGVKFDYMMILEGAQGIRKSTLLRELATIHGTAYFDDTIKVRELGNAATVSKFQGVLIVEFAELAGIGNKDMNELKAEITTTVDRAVLKYQNEPTEFPRQFVFAATINPTDGYLSDPTGNRRFLPVKVERIDIAGVKAVKEQLFAEAAAAWKAGESLELNEYLFGAAKEAADERTTEHPWLSEIQKKFSCQDTVYKDEIWDALGISDRTKRTPAASAEIGKIMVRIGYRLVRRRVGNDARVYVWQRTSDPVIAPDDEEIAF